MYIKTKRFKFKNVDNIMRDEGNISEIAKFKIPFKRIRTIIRRQSEDVLRRKSREILFFLHSERIEFILFSLF